MDKRNEVLKKIDYEANYQALITTYIKGITPPLDSYLLSIEIILEKAKNEKDEEKVKEYLIKIAGKVVNALDPFEL